MCVTLALAGKAIALSRPRLVAFPTTQKFDNVLSAQASNLQLPFAFILRARRVI
jgi:hypothetical protein